MDPLRRQELIVEYLDAVGVPVSGPVRLPSVSEMTVRRDIAKLAQRRRVIKTISGGRPGRRSICSSRTSRNGSRCIARKRNRFADRAVGHQAAADRVLGREHDVPGAGPPVGQAVAGIDRGDALRGLRMEFGGNSDNAHSVFILGGQFDPASATFVGPTAEEAAWRFFVHLAFFSTKGFLPEEGTFESAIAAIRIKEIIAEQATRVVLLADHSKFGQRALCKALDLSRIHEVITDSGTAAADVAALREHGIAVRIPQHDQWLPREAFANADPVTQDV